MWVNGCWSQLTDFFVLNCFFIYLFFLFYFKLTVLFIGNWNWMWGVWLPQFFNFSKADIVRFWLPVVCSTVLVSREYIIWFSYQFKIVYWVFNRPVTKKVQVLFAEIIFTNISFLFFWRQTKSANLTYDRMSLRLLCQVREVLVGSFVSCM